MPDLGIPAARSAPACAPARDSAGLPVRLAAVLIVKDEAAHLARCLTSLRGVVDEIAVYDTGSTDRTVEIARAAGARVVQGTWDGDFARARNAALALTGADWVLSVDADEQVRTGAGGPASLRALLARWEARPRGHRVDVGAVLVDNPSPADIGGSVQHHGPRLLRRDRFRWAGAVHERPVRVDGGPAVHGSCPGDVLNLLHHGYADPDLLRAKAERNADLGRRELDRLVLAGETERLPQALLDLGRSLVGAGRRQDAVTVLESLRELAPGSREAVEGTDALAGLLAGAGHDEVVLLLAEQLRAAGVDRRYCDWLRGQALAQLGRPAEALALLRGVDALVDAAGRRHDLGQVVEMRSLAALLAGERAEALADLVVAMAGHGRVAGRGEMLTDLAEGMPAADVAALLARPGPAHAAAVVAELSRCPEPGPTIARACLAGAGHGFTAGVRVPISPPCPSRGSPPH
jgi:tetratricopeptide (TPR) repeat protein